MKKTKNKQNNQRSFYFNEYNQNLITEKKSGVLNITHDRIYSLFFIFLCLIFIFATKIFFISLKSYDSKSQLKNHNTYKTSRSDIVDRKGEYIARNIPVFHAAIKPSLVKDKKRFLIKLKLIDPSLDYINIKKKFRQK